MDSNFDIRIACEEMQFSFTRQLDGIGKTKTTTRAIFSAASLIVSIIGALQIFNTSVEPFFLIVHRVMIGVVLLLYISLIVVCLIALSPLTTYGPVETKWEVLNESFVNKSEREILLMRLSGYLNAIDKNQELVARVNELTILAGVLLGVIVCILLLLSLLPKV